MAGKGRADSRRTSVLLAACKKAYKKHVLHDDGIGWEELSSVLGEALSCAMGDKKFVSWMDRAGKEKPIV